MNCLRVSVSFVLVMLVWQPTNGMGLERLRRPVSLALSADSNWLFSANRDSGSISVVQTSNRSLANEIEVGGRLTDIASLDDNHLLVLDDKNHKLVLLTGHAADWKVTSRIDVPQFPSRIQTNRNGDRCFIAFLWSRAVTVVDISNVGNKTASTIHVRKRIQIPFEPREMCLTNDGQRLIVGGAFSSRLAVVDTVSFKLIADKKIPGHNIRGMAISSDGARIFITLQELNPLGRSTFDDVHWGNMLSNLLVSLSVDDVTDSTTDVVRHPIRIRLGEPGNAAGDPGQIIVGPSGAIAVLLSGVNEVAIGRSQDEFQRVSVGTRPTAIVATPDGRIFVADTFSDSISIVDVAKAKRTDQVSLGPYPQLSLAQRGETLFFDSRLSRDGWMSCHSCHSDGHSSGQLNDNLSDGSFDAPKRVLSLLGVAQTKPWAWNGQTKTLEQQVTNSIQKTMQGRTPTEDQVAALVAYLKTLAAPPKLVDSAEGAVAAGIRQGQKLFRSLDCQRCHMAPTYTSPKVYDVGLQDQVGNKKFNPPSLRGVGRRDSFFHDARATSLTDVLTKHKHQLDRELSAAELKNLVQFLKSL